MTTHPPAPPAARLCPRCGQTTTPRGGQTPRYCAVCGRRLDAPPAHVRHSFAAGTGRVSGKAVAAICLAILSFVPTGAGLLAAIGAIALAMSATKDIRRWPGRIGGQGLATTAMTLGIIALILQLLAHLGH